MKFLINLAIVWVLATHCVVAATFSVTSAADSGAGSLRQAMLNANATVGADQITFNIGGGGPRSIAPLSPLPILIDPVAIDATTQPGYGGTPIIEINATGLAGFNTAGTDHLFRFDTSNSVVRGFVMNRHGQGGSVQVAVYLFGPNNLVDRNFIGIDLSGTAGFSQPALFGVYISSSNNIVRSNVVASSGYIGIGVEGDNNTIVANYLGTDRDGVAALGLGQALYCIKANNRIGSPGQGNVIAGCTSGIVIRNTAAFSNFIQGNFIGTRAGGTVALTNANDGITVALNAQGTLIGGTNAGEGNVISGNRWGIVLTTNWSIIVGAPAARFTSIAGNHIGLNAAGNSFIVNRAGGIWIDGSPSNNIGGLTVGARNLISGNNGPGMRISGSGALRNVIEGNYVGLRADGLNAEYNVTGIVLDSGATENRVGVFPSGAGRNIISGNVGDGIRLQDVATHYNFIHGNYVGTDAAGSNAVANTLNGINVTGGAYNNFIYGGVVSGNGHDGIALDGNNVAFNFIDYINVGTDLSGLRAVPNGRHGLYLANGARENAIGGQVSLTTVISGNRDTGVYITGAGSSNNVVHGSLIGLSVTDSLSIPNGSNGVAIINAPFNLIGNTNQPGSMRGNVISGQGNQEIGPSTYYYAPGILISGQSSFLNRVEGNFIGTDRFGTRSVSNGVGVIIRDAPRNRIGGAEDGVRNVISGNIVNALVIEQPGASNNIVWGNFIGTDAGGTNAVPNNYGILINDAPGNQIGGTLPGSGNVISGNGGGFGFAGEALSLVGTNAARNDILQNRIGTDLTGTQPLGNEGSGVYLIRGPNNNHVGDVGFGNTIAFNNREGVVVYGGAGWGTTVSNSIYGNSIFNNGQSGTGLGINLQPSAEGSGGIPTPNDPLDADTGPNNLQNYPIITNLFTSAGNTIIRGYLQSTPSRQHYLDFYRSTAANPSGYGEGEIYLSFVSVITDAAGRANFSYTISGQFPNAWFTVTATSAVTSDTSEFSPAYQAAVGSFRMASATRSFNENAGVVPITVERIGGAFGTATVSCFPTNGTALNGQDFTFGGVTLTFLEGETSKFFNIAILEDALDEEDESFTLQLVNPTGGAAITSPAATTVTILDNDPLPSLSISDVFLTEGTGGSVNAAFTVGLNPVSGRTVTVNYTTLDNTATAPADYTATNGVLTFPAGTTSRTITVPIVTDDQFELDESFFVKISDPVNATIAVSPGTCVIKDDDSQPTLSVNKIVVAEGNTGTVAAVFTVSLSNPSYLPVSFHFATSDDTALAGSDYLATNGTVTVPPGGHDTNLVVVVTADAAPEPDETFFLDLSAPVNVTIAGGTGPCTITELRFLEIRRVGNDIQLTFTTGTGQRYAIQTNGTFSPAGWAAVPGLDNLAGIGAPLTVTHLGAGPSAPPGILRAYRVQLLP